MIKLIEYNSLFNENKTVTLLKHKEDMKLSDCCLFEPEEFTYAVNGVTVEKDVETKDGSTVIKKIKIKGKSFNKVLSVILAVALNTATFGTFAGGLFAKGFGKVLLLTGLSFIGGKVINAIAPPPRPDINSSGSKAFEGSRVYGFGQPQNTIGQGYPKALTYGTVRTGGVILGQKISSNGSGQLYNAIYSGGEGEADLIDNILINNEPVSQFSGITVEKRYGTNNQTSITEIEVSSSEIYFTKKIPAGLWEFTDNYTRPAQTFPTTGFITETIQNLSSEYIEFNFSFPNGLYRQFLSDGSIGKWYQYFAFRFTGQVKNVSTNAITTFTNKIPVYNSCRVVSGLNPTTGGFLANSPNSSFYFLAYDIKTHNCTLRIYANEVIWNFTDYGKYIFDGNLSFDLAVYSENQTNYSSYGNLKNTVADTYLESTSQSIGSVNGGNEFIYQNQILLGIKALATEKLNGQRPLVTWEQRRKEIWIYNPDTTAYQSVSSDNPSWIVYDLLHRARKLYNINTSAYEMVVKGVAHTRIDYDAFKELADYCDELVKNKDGTFRKRFTCNIIFDSWLKLTDAIEMVSVICRANLLMKGNIFTIIYQRPQTAVQVFGNKDIILGSFRQKTIKKRETAKAIDFTFFNKDKNYERDTITVLSNDWTDEGYTENKTQISYFGITEFNQAYEEAKYLMRLNQYQNYVCSFRTDIDGAVCQPGDVIELAHELTSPSFSGGVVSSTGNTITLDKAITITAGLNYSVYVRHNDLTSEEFAVINPGNGDFSTFTINGTWTSNPAYFDSYVFGETQYLKKKYIVIEKTREADLYFDINCIEYDERIYTPDSGTINLLPKRIDNRVKTLRCSERLEFEGISSYKIYVTCSWTANKDNYFGARVIVKSGNDNSRVPAEVILVPEHVLYVEKLTSPGKHLVFTVYAKDISGKESEPQIIEYTVNGLPPIPADPTNLKIDEDGINIILSWSGQRSLGFSHWEVRFNPATDPNNIVWNNSQIIAKEVSNNELSVIGKTGTYLVRAVNTAKIYSDNYEEIFYSSSNELTQALDTDITKDDTDTWGETFDTTATGARLPFYEDTGSGYGTQKYFDLPADTVYKIDEFIDAIVDGLETAGTVTGYYCVYNYQYRDFTIGNDNLTNFKIGSPFVNSAVERMGELLRFTNLDANPNYTNGNYVKSVFFTSPETKPAVFLIKEYINYALSTEALVTFGSIKVNYSVDAFIAYLTNFLEVNPSFTDGYEIFFNRGKFIIKNDNILYFEFFYEDTTPISSRSDLLPVLGFEEIAEEGLYYTGSNEYKSPFETIKWFETWYKGFPYYPQNALVGTHQGTANYTSTNEYLVIDDIIADTYEQANLHPRYNATTGLIEAYFEFGEQFVLFHEQSVIIKADLEIDPDKSYFEGAIDIDDMNDKIDDIPQIFDNYIDDYTGLGSQVEVNEYYDSSWHTWIPVSSGGFYGSKFKFRIKLYTPYSFVTPAVLNPKISIYSQYRTETKTLNEADSGSGVHTVTFSKAFETFPAVRIEFPDGEQVANGYQVTLINREQFTVTFWEDYARTIPYEGSLRFTYTAIGY